jgi:hypothetical protein
MIGGPLLRSLQEQRSPSLLKEPCLIRPVLLTSQTSVSLGAQASAAVTVLFCVLPDAQAERSRIAATGKILLRLFMATSRFGLWTNSLKISESAASVLLLGHCASTESSIDPEY